MSVKPVSQFDEVQMPAVAAPAGYKAVPVVENASDLVIKNPIKEPSRGERILNFLGDVWYAFFSLFSCSSTVDCLLDAIEAEDHGLVRGLLFRGVDLNTQGSDGQTPIAAAYNKNDIPMVVKLLSAGATPVVGENQPILCKAIREGKVDMAAALIASESVDVNATEQGIKYSPLMIAYRLGSFDLMKQLIEAGGKIQVTDHPDATIFQLAVLGGGYQLPPNLEIAHRLLQEGLVKVDVDSADDQESFKKAMSDSKGAEIVKSMVEKGFDVNASDEAGLTPLAYAFKHDNRDLALFLAQHKAGFFAHPKENDILNLLLEAQKKSWKDVSEALFDNIPSMVDKAVEKQEAISKRLAVKNPEKVRPSHEELVARIKASYLNFPEEASGRTALHYACIQGDEDFALALINAGANVDAQDNKGMTPLHIGSLMGQERVVDALLAKGAQVNQENGVHQTPFALAVEAGQEAVALALLDKGAVDASAQPALITAYQKMVDSHAAPDATASAQYLATVQISNYRSLLLTLINRGFDVNRRDPQSQATLLHLAASDGDMELVQAIMTHGGDPKVKDSSDRTACQYALAAGHNGVAAFLTSKGGMPTLGDLKTLKQAEYSAFVQEILKIKHGNGKRVAIPMQFLHGALKRNDFELVGILIAAVLEEGTDAAAKDTHDRSLADYALLAGDYTLAVQLKRKGSPINPEEMKKLENAQYCRLVTALIEPDPATRLRSSPQSFIFSAAERGDAALLKLLIEKGADPKAFYQKESGYKGMSPIHIAARKGHVEAVAALIAAGVPEDIGTADGSTPLHIALQEGQRDVTGYLVTRYAAVGKLEHADVKGRTPLHMAALLGDAHSAQVLIVAGAKVDAATKSGLTPLHYVCNLGVKDKPQYYAIAKLLIDNGATKDAADAKGRTPVQFIPENDPINIRELFRLSPKAHKALQTMRQGVGFFADVAKEFVKGF